MSRNAIKVKRGATCQKRTGKATHRAVAPINIWKQRQKFIEFHAHSRSCLVLLTCCLETIHSLKLEGQSPEKCLFFFREVIALETFPSKQL